MFKGALTTRERLMLMALIIVLGAAGILASSKVATRVVCGAWPHMAESNVIFGVIKNLVTLDVRGFVGLTADGCQAPTGLLYGTPIAVLVILVVAFTVGLVRWNTYVHSPAALRRSILKRHEVIAGAAEVTRQVGPKAAISKGRKVRPEHSERVGKRFDPTDAAFHLGTSRNVPVYLSCEDPVLLIGPPRSGKGFGYVISDIIEHPGPVVTTSTRADNMAASILSRSKRGPVYVFDPDGISGRRSSLRWSPILGCEDPTVAIKRAELLIEGTGLGAGDDAKNQEFATKAVEVLQALLHAAAISDVGLSVLYGWTKDPEVAREAIEILRDADVDWGIALSATINLPPEQRSAQWFGVASALTPVSAPTTRAQFDVAPDDGDIFDIDRFLEESGTLYLIAPRKPQGKTGGVGVLLAMLMDAIAEVAHRKAMLTESGRLDPPLGMPLDEIANIFPWPAMPSLMSAGSGEGTQVKPVVQSRAQLRAGWGTEGAVTAWEAAGSKVLLGAGSNESDLKEASALIGERTETWTGDSWSSDRETSHQDNRQWRPGVTVDEMRRLPENTVIVLTGRARAVYVDLIPWIDRDFAEDVKKSLAWHKKHRPSPDRRHLGEVFPIHGLDGDEDRQITPISDEQLVDMVQAMDEEAAS